MILPNCYITIGSTGAYAHWLTDSAAKHLYDGVALVLKRYAGSPQSREKLSAVYETVFHMPVYNLFSEGTFEWITTEYHGPHEDRAKYLAACMLLNEPIESEPPSDGGGRTVDRPIPSPVQPSPSNVVRP
jgi:hypothetical protein